MSPRASVFWLAHDPPGHTIGPARAPRVWAVRALRLRHGHSRRRQRRRRGRLARRIAEELEEVGVGTQQEAGVVALQAVLIRRHRAVEREEIGVLAVGLGEQPVAFAVAGAAYLLGGRIGFGDDDATSPTHVVPPLTGFLTPP